MDTVTAPPVPPGAAFAAPVTPGPGPRPDTHGTGVPPREAGEAAPLRTFIVEDSAIILDNLAATLEETAPVRVVGHAGDERLAVQQLKALREAGDTVDLVIVDVFLKGGSGLGVLRGAATLRPALRCVVLTNYATAEIREKCVELGAARVFDKSNELDDLIAYCTRLAGGDPDGFADPAGAPEGLG